MASSTAAPAQAATPVGPTPAQLCAQVRVGERCKLGNGIAQADCNPCVSHLGWPLLTGVRWQVIEDSLVGHRLTGGPANDTLLGRHGSDTIAGQGGADVIWGDAQHDNNNSRQRDLLSGGDGSDWIYASHGVNTISAGTGNDIVTAYYGRGTIDCGPGRDTVTVLRDRRNYSLKSCEVVLHPGS